MLHQQPYADLWNPEEIAQTITAQIPRRVFLGGMAGAVGLALIGCNAPTQPPVPEQSRISFVAYHNRTASYHQQQITLLSRQGYRPISLSLYGDPARPLYAAVWLKRGGHAWYTFHSVDTAGYQQLYNTWTRRGYRPTVLAATGPQKTTVFAGVFEEDSTPYLMKYHLATTFQDDIIDTPPKEPTSIQYWQNWAVNNNYILRWGALYGDASQPLYAAIWEPNTDNAGWNWFSAFYESSDLFQQRLQAEAEQWVRPSFIALSSDQHVWSIFRDDVIGPWIAHNELTTGEYEAQLTRNTSTGYYPLVVQVSGTGSDTRFAAIFVKSDQPVARQWTVTGISVPALAAADDIMQRYMQRYGIRGGSLAITRQGKLMLARSYTWAEPGYPVTQPTSLFRTASAFKPFTSIAIHQLIERGLLTLDIPVQEILKLKTPDGRPPIDPRFNDILVWHLLSHTGGWNRRIAPDPLFNDSAIAGALHVPLPINKYQMTAYMAGQPLQFTPGTQAVYSNFGYSLLGQIVEKILGLDYESAIQQHIYTPLGLKRPRLAGSLLSQQVPGEVRYHGQYPYIAQSVMSPDQPIVPEPYGGSNEPLGDSLGGQIMAACDYARMLAAFDMGQDNLLLTPATVKIMWTEPAPLAGSNLLRGWFQGKLANGMTAIGHNGGDIGTTTMGFRRPDNISFVVFFNHDYSESLYLAGTINMLGNALSNMADTISAWPDNDLFPSVDIPVFIHLTIP